MMDDGSSIIMPHCKLGTLRPSTSQYTTILLGSPHGLPWHRAFLYVWPRKTGLDPSTHSMADLRRDPG